MFEFDDWEPAEDRHLEAAYEDRFAMEDDGPFDYDDYDPDDDPDNEIQCESDREGPFDDA